MYGFGVGIGVYRGVGIEVGSSVGVGGFTRLIVEGGAGEGGVDMGTNVRASDDAHAVNDKTMKNNREMISLGILFIIFNVELNQGYLSFWHDL